MSSAAFAGSWRRIPTSGSSGCSRPGFRIRPEPWPSTWLATCGTTWAILGGTGYIRNRDEEFAARDLPRAALLEQISEAEAAIESTLPHLTEAQMSQPFPEPIREHHLQTGELLVQLAVHLAYHLGQISYHRRLVTGNAQGVGALSAAELVAARSLPQLRDV